MEWITTATTTVMDTMSTVLDTITSTPILAVIFVGGTIIPLGLRIFKKFKSN